MHVNLISTAAVAVFLTGCGGLYEDVPVYGQSNPSSFYGTQEQQGAQGTVANIGVPDTQAQAAQLGVDPGQEVGQDQYADTDPSALTDFKSTLDPYGKWTDDATYGTVWQPDPGVVGADFAPYVSAGHWDYDNDELWVSDYDWGWAPFHYGRWVYINGGSGWSWVPGRAYSNAWVSWRVGAPGYPYVGWGPLAPTWGWRGGSPYGYGFRVNTPYSFCGAGDMFGSGLQGHMIGGANLGTVALGTHVYQGIPGGVGRSLAHPTVGSGGPPPSHFGIANPAHMVSTSIPGIAKAQAFSRPSTAGAFGAHAPSSYMGGMQAHYPPQGTLSGANRPVATGPRYIGGGAMQPQRVPYSYGRSYGPAQPYRGGAYSGGPFSGGGSRTLGSGGYSGAYRGSGGGGGSFHPSAPTYSHSYSHSYSHGGGHGGGHGGHR